MLGWDIEIYTLKGNGSAPTLGAYKVGRRLASWRASLGGLSWVDQLIAEGRAVQLTNGGFPLTYTVVAGDVLDLLKTTPPCISQSWSKRSNKPMPDKAELNRSAMKTCDRASWVILNAWDRS